jgi:DNA repair exonuclease SbcCD ATPase subunit
LVLADAGGGIAKGWASMLGAMAKMDATFAKNFHAFLGDLTKSWLSVVAFFTAILSDISVEDAFAALDTEFKEMDKKMKIELDAALANPDRFAADEKKRIDAEFEATKKRLLAAEAAAKKAREKGAAGEIKAAEAALEEAKKKLEEAIAKAAKAKADSDAKRRPPPENDGPKPKPDFADDLDDLPGKIGKASIKFADAIVDGTEESAKALLANMGAIGDPKKKVDEKILAATKGVKDEVGKLVTAWKKATPIAAAGLA